MDRGAYELMAATEDHHWWYVGRRRIIADQLTALALPPDATLIELGAGTGGNLPMLRQFGRVSAMEMDDGARAIACAKSGIDVLPGALPDRIPFAPESADVVGLFDVLEHVKEDGECLLAVHRLLKPGGVLLMTVPAHQWLWSAHDEIVHHFHRYSRRDLRQLAQSAGFQVRRLSAFNFLLFPVAAAVRLADIGRTRGTVTGGKAPPAIVNRALTGILSAEATFLRYANLPVGLSFLAVLQKKTTP